MEEKQLCLLALIIFFPMTGAFVSYLTGKYNKLLRNRVVEAITITEFFLTIVLISFIGERKGTLILEGICGLGLSFETDGFRVIYASIAAFMWMMTSLFSAEYFTHYRNRNRYYFFQLITLGATEAIFLSADLYTTFVFFEIMSFASYVWVAQDERKESLRAAETYLAIAVIGGLVMLMGIFLLYQQAGTLQIDELHEACKGKQVFPAALCLFVGFGAKAGAFPLHVWLPKAHPVAPAPASALLSGILTKAGVFGVLVISCRILVHNQTWGTFLLIIGTITMVLGAVLALFSVDFKRTLACSSVSQIGFILVGCAMMVLLGEENALAVRGSFLHMVNHSLFKLTLFMAAGVIYMNLHKLDLNAIRGFGRKKPLLAAVYLAGALGIGGIPGFSGYISKTLIHESIVEYMHELGSHGTEAVLMNGTYLGYSDMQVIEWLFLISGGLTVAYMCKLFFAVFIEENEDKNLQAEYDAMSRTYMNRVSSIVLMVCGLIFPIMGLFPHNTMDILADMGQDFMGVSGFSEKIHYFSMMNLKGGLTSIGIGILIYLILVRNWMIRTEENGRKVYVNRWPKVWDLEDYFYRPVLLKVLPAVCGFFCDILDKLVDTVCRTGIIQGLARVFAIAADKPLDQICKIQPLAGYVEASFFNSIQDPTVIFMKEHVYKGTARPEELEEGNILTYSLGRFLNGVKVILNGTIWRKKPCRKDFVHQLALAYDSFKENTTLIGRSLSYGLLLFCLGLCMTLIYLLVSLLGLH